MIEIRYLQKEDYDLANYIVKELIDEPNHSLSKTHLLKLLSDDNTFLIAALLDDNAIGYALAYKFPSLYAEDYLAYLYDIGVLDEYKRKGAGRGLMEKMLAVLKEAGVDELWLGTAVDNAEGKGLFEATGAVKSTESFYDYTYYIEE